MNAVPYRVELQMFVGLLLSVCSTELPFGRAQNTEHPLIQGVEVLQRSSLRYVNSCEEKSERRHDVYGGRVVEVPVV